jgi:hypothetical protein
MSQSDRPEMETKSFGPFEVKSEDKGEVVAIVATLGVVDKDGDVIQKGAFPPGGANVKLSGYNHDVIVGGAAPVGKGVVTEEGDHAIFRGKFFMSTERGREAFHTTKELGAEGEWSFGFPKAVKTGELSQEWKAKGAKRMIAGLTPIEASPVFVGAGWGTGTLLTKSAEPQADGDPAELAAAVPHTDEALEDTGEDTSHEPFTHGDDPGLPPDEPVETEEAKAAREADTAYKAARAEAMAYVREAQGRLQKMHGDSCAQVQRALNRVGHAA